MIKIIELTEDDVDEVSRIEQDTFSMPWSRDAFMEMIQCEYAYYVVAKDGNEVLGCCGIRNMCGDGEITNVVVKREARKKGIGEIMLLELMERSKKIGVRAYTLEVRESNLPAIQLYKKFGFETEGIRKNFYDKPQEDALIMWKR
ncbi:MAG: ribosomal protein S18-alanine N-acetyltransferase [Lachnospiraceae bacterium]|nr:ribosomal protein S18-alanine N-acetyltransferase [Lachnospiraceae bacterium]